MLRRTGFKRATFTPPPPAPPRPATRRATYDGAVIGNPISKDEPVRSEEYRRIVASLPCKHCGIVGYSQAAHPNAGKGTGTKTDDRACFPLCTVHPSPGGGGYVRGCHERFDQGALYPKEARRLIEPAWSADTRRHILASGQWPKNLPLWTDQPKEMN
jgi:hypothetical protein